MVRERNQKEEELFKLLEGVIDPELMVNIVDLGLVYDVRLDDTNKKIVVDLTLTSPSCPLGEVIIGDAEQLIKKNNETYEVKINLVWEPMWTLDRLTQKGREILGRS